jgi:hypothetical protein
MLQRTSTLAARRNEGGQVANLPESIGRLTQLQLLSAQSSKVQRPLTLSRSLIIGRSISASARPLDVALFQLSVVSVPT